MAYKGSVNQAYWDALDEAMALLPEPTIQDALNFMHAQGNEAFIKAFSNLKGTKKPFDPYSNKHEIAHICGRLGHTPQHEKWVKVFDMSFSASTEASKPTLKVLKEDIINICKAQQTDKNTDPQYSKDASGIGQIPSDRDLAIYSAAGMYLKQKIDTYIINGFMHQSYEKQKQFCDDYPNPTKAKSPKNFSFPMIPPDAPYSLIKLSDQEWKEITKVALGLWPAEKSLYPERLKPIRTALETAGIAMNLGNYAERIKQGRMSSAASSPPL